MQKSISKRSAVAKPPRKTLVGVAGKGLSLGHSVEPMMTTFPEIKLLLHIRFSSKLDNYHAPLLIKAEQLSREYNRETIETSCRVGSSSNLKTRVTQSLYDESIFRKFPVNVIYIRDERMGR